AWHVVSTGPPRFASQHSDNFRPRPPAGGVATGLRPLRRRFDLARASPCRQGNPRKADTRRKRAGLSAGSFVGATVSAPLPPAQCRHARPTGTPPCSVPRPPCATGGML